jgi:dihydroflavonol-4-reductase
MIAVTGANGLVGSYIVRKLRKLNTPFVALKRKDSDISFLNDINQTIEWREADVTDPVSLREAFDNVTGVIHAAAYVSFNPRNRNKIFDINTIGTQNVVNTCLLKNVKRLVHISSVAALGRQKTQTFLNEENKWSANALGGNYAESKYKAELEVFRGQEEGLSTAILNPSVILGYSNWNKSSTQLFKYIWKEKPFYIDGTLNYVDVRDVADISIKLFHATIENERFIASAGHLSYLDFFSRVADTFGKKRPTLKVSPTWAKILAQFESVRTKLINAEPLISPETARLADTFFTYDNQKVKKSLNHEFLPIDNTITWCCQQFELTHVIKNK